MAKKKLSHKRHSKTAKPVGVGVKTSMEVEFVFKKSDLPLLKKAVAILEKL